MIGSQFVKVEMPNLIVTAVINTRAPTLIPSSILDVQGEFLSLGIIGFISNTMIKEGKKTPMVANIAPGSPFNIYPMKVEVVNIGPGVNSPIATASISWGMVTI